MKNLGYYNGKIGLLEEMTVPMLDRACYFGDGFYDAAYSRNHIVYALDEHIDRFFESAALLHITIPMTKKELSDLICDLVRQVDDGEQFVYWQVTRGTAIRTHAFAGEQANLWIMLRPCRIRDLYRKNRLISVPDTRFYHCNIKSLNLIPNILAMQKATEAGVDECVFCRDGIVTETAHSNISILKDGRAITHPRDNLILAGVGRKHFLEACRHFGMAVEERDYTLEELQKADEVILTAAGSLCLSASELDGQPVGGKAPELLKQLQDYLLNDYLEKTGGGTMTF